MSYNLELFRRQPEKDFKETVEALIELQEGKIDSPGLHRAFVLDKRLIASEILTSDLSLESNVDLDDEVTSDVIELSTIDGAEPQVQFLCTDYSVVILIPYGEQSGQWLEGLLYLWSVILNICERNHLVFYDGQLDCEASLETFESMTSHLKEAHSQLKGFMAKNSNSV